jgi:hypothetical protein
MHTLVIALIASMFLAIGATFWAVAGDRGVILWVIFGFGMFSLGRWYEREHANSPSGEQPRPVG